MYKRIIATSSLLALLGASQLQATPANTFVMERPTVTSPKNNDTVSKSPALAGSNAVAKDTATGNALTDLVLEQSQWLVYEPDETLDILGGFHTLKHGLNLLNDNMYQDVDYPLDTTIDGAKVKKLRIYAAATVELLDSDNKLLGKIKAIPTALHKIQPSHGDNSDALIFVKHYNNGVIINWPLKSTDTSAPWSATLQAVINDNGEIGIRSSVNDLSNSLFALTDGSVGCTLRSQDTLQPSNPFNSLNSLKSRLESSVSKFSWICEKGDDGNIKNTAYKDATPQQFTIPDYKIFTSTDKTYTLKESEALKTGHKYNAHVRYTGTSATYTDDKSYSSWSKPVTFVTDIQSLYSITTPKDIKFVAGKAKTLSFEFSNTGTEAGSPSVSVRVPFNVISRLNGTLSDFYSSSIDGKKCGDIKSENNSSTFTCSVDKLSPGESRKFDVKLTFNKDDKELEYRVCEASKCDKAPYSRLPVTVESDAAKKPSDNQKKEPAKEKGTSSKPKESSSSSSGGGAFWLLLLALPLFRMARKK